MKHLAMLYLALTKDQLFKLFAGLFSPAGFKSSKTLQLNSQEFAVSC